MGPGRLQRLASSALVLTLCLPLTGLEAQTKVERSGSLYKWKDDKGRWHYSESLPQNQEFDTLELNKHGRVVREVELHRNPGQQKNAKEQLERARQEKQLAVQRQRDDALLRTYTDEREIDDSRERNIALPEQAIAGLQLRLSQSRASLQGLRKQTETYAARGEVVPPGLNEDIAEEKKEVQRIERDIERYEQQIVSIRERYDDDKRRFRELKGTKDEAPQAANP